MNSFLTILGDIAFGPKAEPHAFSACGQTCRTHGQAYSRVLIAGYGMASLAASKRYNSRHANRASWLSSAVVFAGGSLAVAVLAATALLSVLSYGSTAQRLVSGDTRFKVAIVDHKRLPLALSTSAPIISSRRDDAIEKVAEELFPLDGTVATKAPKMVAAAEQKPAPPVADVAAPEEAVAFVGPSVRELEQARAARLALVDSLGRQRLEHARQERFPTVSVPTADDVPIQELAYGPMPTTRQVMNPEDDPFNAILPGSDEGEAGIILPDDDAPIPTFRPAAPLANVQLPSPPSPSSETVSIKPDAPSEERKSIFSIFSSKSSLPPRGSRIAVYDITKSVVYMPNGDRLEAHSGRGPTRDRPEYANVAGRGPTPPNVYSLRMRESLFHGVEAIRMTPVGSGRMYGRNGILTHSYLRRVPGDSAGCVAFADYPEFLKAFKRGDVNRLIVVPSMGELPQYMAML
jgi:hypothetical protein